MSELEKTIRLNELYDFYNSLLTDRQKEYFEEYYFNNLSLKEISLKYNVSRNAVHLCLKDVNKELEEYEEKLFLLKKYKERDSLYSELKEIENKDVQEILNKLLEIE